MTQTTIVYLIHLNSKIGHAQHYIGSTDDLENRLAEHAASTWESLPEPTGTKWGGKRTGHTSGKGTPLLAYANSHGITWQLARTWEGNRTVERELKNKKCSPKLCPICNPAVKTTSPALKGPPTMAIDRMLRNVTTNTTTWYPDGADLDDALFATASQEGDTVTVLLQTYEVEQQGTFRLPGADRPQLRFVRKVTDERIIRTGKVTQIDLSHCAVTWSE